jgi:hypothetical protein
MELLPGSAARKANTFQICARYGSPGCQLVTAAKHCLWMPGRLPISCTADHSTASGVLMLVVTGTVLPDATWPKTLSKRLADDALGSAVRKHFQTGVIFLIDVTKGNDVAQTLVVFT